MKQVPNRENYLKTKDRSTKTKEELHEEKKKLKKQKKDKELMRQQRKKIRLREKLKINAQEQLHRLHKEVSIREWKHVLLSLKHPNKSFF